MTKLITLFFALIALVSFETAASAATYRTTCRIVDGEAKGYIQFENPSSTSFSGKAWFYQYNDNGDQVANDSTTVGAVIVGHDLEYVDEVSADSDATSCSFDVGEIIGPSDGDEPQPTRDYVTFCDVRGGQAYGAMKLTGSRSSVSFSGKVWFTFYDDNGNQLDRDWTTAIVIVVGHDKEPVDDLAAPRGATSCSLDISEAIGD